MAGLTRRRFGRAIVGVGSAPLLRPPVEAPARDARVQTPALAAGHGGTPVFGLEQEPTTLVAATTTDNVTKVSAKVTEGLLTYDLGLRPVPQPATAWSISEDGLRYTFTLRHSVKWHDGADFTSAAVGVSTRLLQHPRGRAAFAPVARVKTPDPHTAVPVLSKPTPYLLHALYPDESPIVPRHAHGSGDPQGSPNATSIGTGPFQFNHRERGSCIEFERNPDHRGQPNPVLGRVICRVVTDAAARTVLFETRDAHLGGKGAVQLPGRSRIQSLPHIGSETIGFTFHGGVRRLYWSKNRKPGVPFSNASHYNDPGVDRLLESAAVETDAKQRRIQFLGLQAAVARDLPDINFLTDHHYALYDKRPFGRTTQATGISGSPADAHFA